MEPDTHFYVDNAPPQELLNVLRVLSPTDALAPKEIQTVVRREYGEQAMQKDQTYTPKRLLDLGVTRRESGRHELTPRGVRLQSILLESEDYTTDLLHYLHFTLFDKTNWDHKLLWTYRRVCEEAWEHGMFIEAKEIAASLQSELRERFTDIDFEQTREKGARIDATGVQRVGRWLKSLSPPPFTDKERTLHPRTVEREELALLALDDVYRHRGHAYGDLVLLDDDLVRAVAGVFFLDLDCCRALLLRAARRGGVVEQRDTLAGVSLRLTRPFGVEECA